MTDYLRPGKTTANQHYAEATFKLFDIVKQKHWRKLSLRSLTFSWQCTSGQVIGCSASSPWLWICSTEPSCLQSRTGSHYLIRNLFFVEPGLQMMNHWWSLSRHGLIVKKNKKFYFQGKNSWEEKLKRCIDVAGEYVKNDIICDLMLIFYRQVAKIFDHPSCWLSNHVSTAIISDSSSINQVQRRRNVGRTVQLNKFTIADSLLRTNDLC